MALDIAHQRALPSITVITPTLNSVSVLQSCIDSVVAQNTFVEHVIVDGGSCDGTQEVVALNAGSITKVIVEKDRGLYDAINKGIEASKGEIIAVLNADDIYAFPDALKSALMYLCEAEADAAYADLEYVGTSEAARVIRRWRAGEYHPRNFYRGWMPPHPTFFVRRECYEKYGLYRLDLGTAADYELMLRFLLVHGIRVKYIPRVLVKMRVGGASNASLRARLRANRMDRKAWEVNGLKPYPWTLIAKPLRKIGQWWVK